MVVAVVAGTCLILSVLLPLLVSQRRQTRLIDKTHDAVNGVEGDEARLRQMVSVQGQALEELVEWKRDWERHWEAMSGSDYGSAARLIAHIETQDQTLQKHGEALQAIASTLATLRSCAFIGGPLDPIDPPPHRRGGNQ